MKPWLVGLSAVATQNSGWMFIGQIGFTYAVGLHSIWLMIGWITGDLFTSFFVHKRLREQAEKRKILSFSGMLANWHGEDYKIVRIVGAILTPPDVISQIMLALPLWFLYEAGVFVARFVAPRENP